MASIEYYATGRRKTSTARVFLRPGNGLITVTYATPSAVTFASAKEAATIKGKLLTFVLVSDEGSSQTDWTAQ